MTELGKHNKYGLDPVDHSYASAANTLPVYTIPEIANYLTRGYWKDQDPSWGWRSWASDHKTITYNIDALSSEHQALARLAFATWDEFSKLKFVEDSGDPASDIQLTATADAGSYEEDDAFSGHRISHASINVDPNDFSDTRINSDLTWTYIHEIGHALGLGHGGNYNGVGAGTAPYQNDTRQFSVMSYVAQGAYGDASSIDVLTPQMADIYAVIQKYGAASVHAGNTTYGFHASGQTAATGFLYDFNNFDAAHEFGFNGIAPALTIVDTGGIDTLDLSGYFFNQKIDLRGGQWSDAGQYHKNIGIYITSVIENAVGGTGNDRITGNAAANWLKGNDGADRLLGREGNDRLTGGDGADIFVFNAGWDKDKITDFQNDIDKIDLRAFGFKSYADVVDHATASASGETMLLRFGHGDVLTIAHLAAGEMNAADFVLL